MAVENIKTSVIVPCYNAFQWLRPLIPILEQEPCRIIAVDDGSTDNTWEFLAARRNVEACRNVSNLGFALTNNRGAEAAKTPYLLFLNADTAPEKGFIKAMEKRMESDEKIAVVGAKLIFAKTDIVHVFYEGAVQHIAQKKGRLQHAGIDLASNLRPLEVGRNEDPALPQFNIPRECLAVTAACLLIKRRVFNELKGFDVGFKNGWEDSDLCLRARERGYKIWYEPKAVVHHYHATSPARFEKEDDNLSLWLKRWHQKDRVMWLMKLAKKLKPGTVSDSRIAAGSIQ